MTKEKQFLTDLSKLLTQYNAEIDFHVYSHDHDHQVIIRVGDNEIPLNYMDFPVNKENLEYVINNLSLT